jgi:hypothetical protein
MTTSAVALRHLGPFLGLRHFAPARFAARVPSNNGECSRPQLPAVRPCGGLGRPQRLRAIEAGERLVLALRGSLPGGSQPSRAIVRH